MFRKISTASLLCMVVFGASMVMAQKISKDLDDTINSASNWVGWKPEDSFYPKEDGKKALEDGKICIEKIDEALSKGLAASTMVETQTPEDYRESPLWCTTGVDREGILPVWSVDCWRFKGMTRVGSVESRSGTGDQAPSSAFR